MKVMFSCFECNLSECLFLFTGCEKRFQWNATFNSRVAGTVQKGGAVCVWTCVHIQPSGMSSRCADIPQGSPQSTTCAYGVYIYRQYFIGFCGKPLLHKFVFQKLNRKQLSLISESKWVQPWYPTGRHCSFVCILHTHISFSTNLHILLFAYFSALNLRADELLCASLHRIRYCLLTRNNTSFKNKSMKHLLTQNKTKKEKTKHCQLLYVAQCLLLRPGASGEIDMSEWCGAPCKYLNRVRVQHVMTDDVIHSYNAVFYLVFRHVNKSLLGKYALTRPHVLQEMLMWL